MRIDFQVFRPLGLIIRFENRFGESIASGLTFEALLPIAFVVALVFLIHFIVRELINPTGHTIEADVVLPTVAGECGYPTVFAAATFERLLSAPRDEGTRAVVYAEAAEQSIRGKTITEQTANTAGERSLPNAAPLSDNGYKIPLTSNLIKRALLNAGRVIFNSAHCI